MLFTAIAQSYTGTITWNPLADIEPPESLNNLIILNTVEDGAYTNTTYLNPLTTTTFELNNLTIDMMYNVELDNYVVTGEINELNPTQINLTVAEAITPEDIPDSDEEEGIPMEQDDENITEELPSMIIDPDPEDDEEQPDDPSEETDGDEEGDEEGGDDSIDIIDIDIPNTLAEDEIEFLKQQALEELNALIDEWKLKGIEFTYDEQVIDQDLFGTYTELVPGPNLTIDTEIDPSENLGNGKTVEDLQENIQIDVTQEVINGTLKYIEGFTSYSQDEALQNGYFLALHLNTTTQTFDNPIIRVELDETKQIIEEGIVIIRIDRELAEVDKRYINVSLVQNDGNNEVYWLQIPLLINVEFEEHSQI